MLNTQRVDHVYESPRVGYRRFVLNCSDLAEGFNRTNDCKLALLRQHGHKDAMTHEDLR